MPLTIEDNGGEYFDSDSEEFVTIPHFKFTIEHSLISVYKWEGIHKKAFVKTQLSGEELHDYIRCMTMGEPLPVEYYKFISKQNVMKIIEYVKDPMTATILYKDPVASKTANNKPGKDVMTSEMIYYAMFANQIPKECEKWHFNRLLILLGIFADKNEQANGKTKKMSKSDIYSRNAEINKINRAKYHSKG